MMLARSKVLSTRYLEGWPLAGLLALTLALLCLWIAAMRQFDVDGVRLVVRFTARTSLLFFCMAFVAAPLVRLWPNAGTRWQRRNRRYLGVTFAASHVLHAIALAVFATIAPADFAEATTTASWIFGGTGYAFIAAMAATSLDRTAAAIGRRAWRILHTAGIYYVWFQFMISFGMRIPQMPNYVWFLVPLIVVMAVRITAALVGLRVMRRAAG